MTNSLKISSETYEGVTAIPHFPIEIAYEGCQIAFEDIYFDDLDALPQQLAALEASRKGEVVLDGGSRCRFRLSCDSRGGLEIAFRAEPTPFPGRLLLEGTFVVDGERTASVLAGFSRLISAGEALSISA